MKAVAALETSQKVFQKTRRHIPEDLFLLVMKNSDHSTSFSLHTQSPRTPPYTSIFQADGKVSLNKPSKSHHVGIIDDMELISTL
jgi:hypothetical protein